MRYADEAALSRRLKGFVRWSIPSAAILLPAAFFFSVLTPDASEPNSLIYLAYVGAVVLAAGILTLGVGLVKRPPPSAMPAIVPVSSIVVKCTTMKLRQSVQIAFRASGMSQAELARVCDIDKGNLSKFLSGRGESAISVAKLQRVLDRLGLAVKYEYESAVDRPEWMTQVNASYALLQGKIKGVPDEDLHQILVSRFQPFHERAFILKKLGRSYAL